MSLNDKKMTKKKRCLFPLQAISEIKKISYNNLYIKNNNFDQKKHNNI